MKKIAALFFLFLFIVFFFGAFSTYYFNDDFYFLKISQNFNLISFLSPIRTTFYRPFPTEFFYFVLQRLPFPIITGHLIVFSFFLIGLFFLYKTVLTITKSHETSVFSLILYAFHFSHVYQIYWFATFQEVAQFTFLIGSLYFILSKRFFPSIILFVLALFSKEQALLFPFVAFFFYFFKYKKGSPLFIIYLLLGGLFAGVHFFVNSRMPVLQEYIIHLSPKLIINNTLWYGLWSMGFPAMMSDYMRSIFSLPFGNFWNYFSQPSFLIYFFGMLVYWALIAVSIIYIIGKKSKERKGFVLLYVIGLAFFIFFLLPVLPIIHKWMVRLTIPLIFITVIQGTLLALLWKLKIGKPFVVMLLVLYLTWNYFGVKQHEIISTYRLESSITKNAIKVFANTKRFENCNTLYIADPKEMKVSSWEGSEKLALTFSGDSFLTYYFQGKNDMKVIYEYRTTFIKSNNCIIYANDLIK